MPSKRRTLAQLTEVIDDFVRRMEADDEVNPWMAFTWSKGHHVCNPPGGERCSSSEGDPRRHMKNASAYLDGSKVRIIEVGRHNHVAATLKKPEAEAMVAWVESGGKGVPSLWIAGYRKGLKRAAVAKVRERAEYWWRIDRVSGGGAKLPPLDIEAIRMQRIKSGGFRVTLIAHDSGEEQPATFTLEFRQREMVRLVAGLQSLLFSDPEPLERDDDSLGLKRGEMPQVVIDPDKVFDRKRSW